MRRVLITGGSGGIGSAMARDCAARGWWPIVAYARNEQGAARTVRACGAGQTLHIDLLESEWDLGALSELDSIVHCAGLYSRQRTLLDSDPDEVRKLLEVNALGPLRLTQAIVAGGAPLSHCLVVLSTAMYCRGGGPYALSKAASFAVCKLLARELAPRGIRVHGIVPGWTETAMAAAAATASGRTLQAIRSEHPEGHLLEPREIGHLAVKLLADEEAHDGEGQLVFWDLRDSREPVWTNFQDAPLFDTAR